MGAVLKRLYVESAIIYWANMLYLRLSHASADYRTSVWCTEGFVMILVTRFGIYCGLTTECSLIVLVDLIEGYADLKWKKIMSHSYFKGMH